MSGFLELLPNWNNSLRKTNMTFQVFKNKVIHFNTLVGVDKILRWISDTYEEWQNPTPKQRPPKAKPGWSIVVITSAQSIHNLEDLIRSAKEELQGSPYEIIVVGPKKELKELEAVYGKEVPLIIIPYREFHLWGVYGCLTKKKNIGVMKASYNNVVMTHDYITLIPGWKAGFEKFGDFNACANIVLNKDGKRYTDWLTFDHPTLKQTLIPYTASYHGYQYLNGTYIVVKRDFMLDNMWDENLRAFDGEDVEWSKRIQKKIILTFNPYSTIKYSKQKPDLLPSWYATT
jgi:hypothetical protein